jgi:hypothetical protein
MKNPCKCVHFILFFLRGCLDHVNEESYHSPNIDLCIQSITTGTHIHHTHTHTHTHTYTHTHTHTHTHTFVFVCVSIVQDIAQLCQEEKDSGNQTSFCLDYLLASTQYDWFVQVLQHTHTHTHTHTHRHTCQICLICRRRQICLICQMRQI